MRVAGRLCFEVGGEGGDLDGGGVAGELDQAEVASAEAVGLLDLEDLLGALAGGGAAEWR